MQLAELSKRKFEAERHGQEVVETNTVIPDMNGVESLQNAAGMINKFLTEETIKNPKYKALKIPRRPEWNKEMSAQEIQSRENISFLEWRRDIASIEENNVKLAITPFEKNLEVWK